MVKRSRDSEGRFSGNGFSTRFVTGRARALRWWPAPRVAAAGAFLWTRRGQIGDMLSSGMDRLSELKSERMGSHPTQRKSPRKP